MTCWVVIPLKAIDECKTRLRPALGDAERRALVRRMLLHVLQAAHGARGVDHVALLGPERHEAPDWVEFLPDTGTSLNAALTSALTLGASRIVIVPADLPKLRSADVEALIQVQPDAIAIAPDRAGAGTNALSLPLPQAQAFRFQFGEGSFQLHSAEAERLGLPLAAVRSETLGLDVDTAADLAEA